MANDQRVEEQGNAQEPSTTRYFAIELERKECGELRKPTS